MLVGALSGVYWAKIVAFLGHIHLFSRISQKFAVYNSHAMFTKINRI